MAEKLINLMMTDSEHTNSATQVAFVVPARNEERHLEACLKSIWVQSSDTVEISVTVVDNESTDNTAAIATGCGAQVARVKPGNPGRARNVGAAVKSDFIAFVDADCILPLGWLAQGLAHLSDPAVAGVGSVQAPAPADAPWVERVWVTAITPRCDSPWEPVPWLAAFNLLVRHRDFAAIQGFDESLETCEDSDLSFRLAERGELRRDHAYPVRHLGESRSVGEFFRREMWRSRGNLRSAWKRGSLAAEFVSLFVPVAYVLLWIITVVSVAVAVLWGGRWWWTAAGILAAALVAGPALIAGMRYGLKQYLATSVLLGIYLLARGIGPFVPSPRVSRGKAFPKRS